VGSPVCRFHLTNARIVDGVADPARAPSYPRQNSLALALRELGRIERTLFMLQWLRDPALRQRVTAGLNKGRSQQVLGEHVNAANIAT
jgi:TnpA family transposase